MRQGWRIEEEMMPGMVTIQRNPSNHRVAFRKRETVPLRGHRPARSAFGRIFEFRFCLAVGAVFIIVVPQHGIALSGKHVCGIDIFKLIFPAARIDASRQPAVPVVSQQQKGFDADAVIRSVFPHGARYSSLLALMALLPPVAKREKMVRVRRKLYLGPHTICKKAVQPMAERQRREAKALFEEVAS